MFRAKRVDRLELLLEAVEPTRDRVELRDPIADGVDPLVEAVDAVAYLGRVRLAALDLPDPIDDPVEPVRHVRDRSVDGPQLRPELVDLALELSEEPGAVTLGRGLAGPILSPLEAAVPVRRSVLRHGAV